MIIHLFLYLYIYSVRYLDTNIETKHTHYVYYPLQFWINLVEPGTESVKYA